METSIQIEEEKSKSYELLPDERCKNLVALTLENVSRVEAMIRMDSNYTMSGNVDAIPSKRTNGTLYYGSTAYWMTLLKRIVNGENNIESKVVKDGKIEQKILGWKDVCIEAIAAVDRENSTHLNVANGREVFLQNLTKIYLSGNLISLLKCPQYIAKEFIINLLNPSVLVNMERNKRNYKYERKSYSFTTKFCHYACYYLFDGKPEQDNFSIYDDILGKSVGAYAQHYDIDNIPHNKKDFQNYATYSKVIDNIRLKAAEETGYLISRNGFDHLLWYYHKGHPIQK